MNYKVILFTVVTGTLSIPVSAESALDKYLQQLDVTTMGADKGKDLWLRQFSIKGEHRSCVSCHNENPRLSGKHIRTGKLITAMAPSVNAERFSDIRKIKKWIKRNCKWTLGRECTAQEQADVLQYLRNL